MKSKKNKKINNSGRPPTYKEMIFDFNDTKTFFKDLRKGKKIMLSLVGDKKFQLGIFTIVKMKGYTHISGADGSKRRLEPFNRVKFIPTKEFKKVVKHI